MIRRDVSILQFLGLSIVGVLGSFLVIYHFTEGKLLNFLTSNFYSKLSFDLYCGVDLTSSHGPKCAPFQSKTSFNDSEADLSPTEFLWNVLAQSDQTDEAAMLSKLLSSVMLNGLPLLGMDDFVRFSDTANGYIGAKARSYIMSNAAYRDKFGNFLDVRRKHIRIAPDNCWTRGFYWNLLNQSAALDSQAVTIHESINEALESIAMDDIWSVVIMQPNEQTMSCDSLSRWRQQDLTFAAEAENKGPDVIIRMAPTSLPDTRNFEWSPRKNYLLRERSGQLLYFLSGFLSLQLEIQNFLASVGIGKLVIKTNILPTNQSVLLPTALTRLMADTILSVDSDDIFSKLVNTTMSMESMAYNPASNVPLYLKAFPTHSYQQIEYWHTFAILLTLGLVLFFSIPPTLCASMFQRERDLGHLDMLASIESVKIWHSALSWLLLSFCISSVFAACTWLFFEATLQRTAAALPSIALFLCGNSLGPLSIVLGSVVGRADALVMSVPLAVFIGMLPGLLYPDLAFDGQRNLWVELLLCLSPPSAAALILRYVFSVESLGVAAEWNSKTPIAKTPLYSLVFVLFLDMLAYSIACLLLIGRIHFNDWRFFALKSNRSRTVGNQCNFLRVCTEFYFFLQRMLGPRHTRQISDSPDSSLRTSPTHISTDFASSPYFHLEFPRTCMVVRNLSKSYGGSEVLRDVTCELEPGQTTCLLGGNGAGKSTLIKILAGIDRNYSGVAQSTPRFGCTREIGWCPQMDTVFDYLTVEEHLQLVWRLLKLQNSDPFTTEQNFESEMSQLNLLDHSTKLARELSGGMKRRLCLLMSSIGQPSVWLLDEPTSGCDSLTRELVRKFILSKSSHQSCLLSTHHLDDVEVVAGKIWFLDDKSLAFNGVMEELLQRSFREGSGFQILHEAPTRYIELSTLDAIVRKHFEERFPPAKSENWAIRKQPPVSKRNKITCAWRIPSECWNELFSFISTLDKHGLNYELVSPSPKDALVELFDPKSQPSHEDNMDDNATQRDESSSRRYHLRVFEVLLLRWQTLQHGLPEAVFSQLIVPFLVTFAICLSCSEVAFSAVKITGHTIRGIGNICISNGQVESQSQQNYVSHLNNQIKKYHNVSHWTWRGRLTSDELFDFLFSEYYEHHEKRRGAFVLQDFVPSWAESTVYLRPGNNETTKLAFEQVRRAQRLLCVNSTKYATSALCQSKIDLQRGPAEVTYFIHENRTQQSFLHESELLTISVSKSLFANLTLLTNVTTDHAAPIFLKEVLPMAYNAISTSVSEDVTSSAFIPSYNLYNQPLPMKTAITEVSIERGHLGSSIVVLYMLILTCGVVRVVVKLNRENAKSQLFSTSLSPLSYWLSHLLFDSLFLCLSLASCWTAILIIGIVYGYNPVYKYFFFDSKGVPIYIGILMPLFSFAITASSHCYCVWSSHPFASQLSVLFGSVFGGLVLKLFLERVHGHLWNYFEKIAFFLWPSFTFTIAMFDCISLSSFAMGQSLGAQIHPSRVEGKENEVKVAILLLVIQAVVYFHLTVWLEYHSHLLWHQLHRASRFCSTFLGARVSSSRAVKNAAISQISEVEFAHIAGETTHLVRSMSESVAVEANDPHNWMPLPIRSFTMRRDLRVSGGAKHVNFVEYSTRRKKVILSAQDLSATYSHNPKPALSHVTLDIADGERIALLGINGGGKSTFFKSLTLSSEVSFSGNVTMMGIDFVSNFWEINERMFYSYLPQEGGLLEFLTARENIELVCSLKGKPFPATRFETLGGIFPEKYLNYKVDALSGGNKKKLSLLLVTLGNSKLLLLDECTSGIDPVAAEQIVRRLRSVESSKAMLFSSHRIDECTSVCERIVVLNAGKVSFDSSSAAFVELANAFYQVDVVFNTNDGFEKFLERVNWICGYQRRNHFVRIVEYGSNLARFTLDFHVFPRSEMFWLLHQLGSEFVLRFSFRKLDLEETLSLLINSFASNS